MTPSISSSPTPLAPWFERDGVVVIPRPRKTTDAIRIALAYLATAGAVGYAVVGFLSPETVGLSASDPGLYYMTAPAILIAALIHLYLIISGVRRPYATFTAHGVALHGYYFPSKEITRIAIQHNPMSHTSDAAALVLTTTREDAPSVVAVPPGFMPDAELSKLFSRIKAVRG